MRVGISETRPRVFYRSEIRLIGKSPEHLLFWDDAPANIEAAKSRGIQAELFVNTHIFQQRMLDYFPLKDRWF